MANAQVYEVAAYAPRPTQEVAYQLEAKSSPPDPEKPPPNGWDTLIGLVQVIFGLGAISAFFGGEFAVSGGFAVGLYMLHSLNKYRLKRKIPYKKAWSPPRVALRETKPFVWIRQVVIYPLNIFNLKIRPACTLSSIWSIFLWFNVIKRPRSDDKAELDHHRQPLRPQLKFGGGPPNNPPTAIAAADPGDDHWRLLLIILLVLIGFFLIFGLEMVEQGLIVVLCAATIRAVKR